MSNWRETAARALEAKKARGDQGAENGSGGREETPPDLGAPPQALETVDGTCGLPADLWAGLTRLQNQLPPATLTDRNAWSEVVADAMRLAREGWAAKALALGWTPADLFGCGADGSDQFEGLAIWLRGRPIAVMDAASAAVTDAPKCVSIFNRPDQKPRRDGVEVVPLWRWGRAR